MGVLWYWLSCKMPLNVCRVLVVVILHQYIIIKCKIQQAVREAATICPAPCDLESGVLVTCDVGYLCANFSLPTPLGSRLRTDVRDRQASDSIIA